MFRKFFTSEVWPEVGRKFIYLVRRPKTYESGQHPHVTSFRYLSVFYSEKGVWKIGHNCSVGPPNLELSPVKKNFEGNLTGFLEIR